MTYTLTVNGRRAQVDAAPGTPLLWVLRDHLSLVGTKFGCGMAQCGACMVLFDGERTYSCQLSVESAAGHEITTIEGLKGRLAEALKRAWLAEATPQCGYCQSGQIISAVDLLSQNKKPSRAEIRDHMRTNLCRCGTYLRIARAIERAADEASSQT